MTSEPNINRNLQPVEQLYAFIGTSTRSASIDGHPQLFKDLNGDMAIMGRFPLLVQYLTVHFEEQYRRFTIRLKLNNWGHVHGR